MAPQTLNQVMGMIRSMGSAPSPFRDTGGGSMPKLNMRMRSLSLPSAKAAEPAVELSDQAKELVLEGKLPPAPATGETKWWMGRDAAVREHNKWVMDTNRAAYAKSGEAAQAKQEAAGTFAQRLLTGSLQPRPTRTRVTEDGPQSLPPLPTPGGYDPVRDVRQPVLPPISEGVRSDIQERLKNPVFRERLETDKALQLAVYNATAQMPGDPFELAAGTGMRQATGAGDFTTPSGGEPIFKAPPPPALIQLMERRNLLHEENPDNPDIALLDAHLQPVAAKAGFSFAMAPDGTLVFGEGTAPAAQQLGIITTAARRDKTIGNRDFTQNVVAQIDDWIKLGTDDPTLLGAVGSARRAGQSVLGMGKDVGRLLPGSDAIFKIADQLAKKFVDLGIVDEDLAFSELQNPNVPALQVFENTIAMAIARNRQPQDRILKDVYLSAKEDAKITGFKSSYDVIQKMRTLRAMLVNDISIMNKQLGIGTPENRYAWNPITGLSPQ